MDSELFEEMQEDLSQDVNVTDLETRTQHIYQQLTHTIRLDWYEDNFPTHRKYDNARWDFNINIAPPHYDYPIHDEAPRKILSIIHYVYGDESTEGTVLYDENKQYVTTIEWKPNRALVFAALDGITWHSYRSGNSPRITANTFLTRTGNRPD